MTSILIKKIQKMSEAAFTSDVVEPLLRKMFVDDRIEYTHGPTERGRDLIIYSKHDKLDRLKIICIQIKNHKFNQVSSSPYSIICLTHQIKQAITTGVTTINGDSCFPSEMWVINPYPLTDTVRRQAAPELEESKSLNAHIIDAFELEKLLTLHCPDIVSDILHVDNNSVINLISSISTHKESRAFKLRFDRNIEDFYINMSIFLSGSLTTRFLAEEYDISNYTFKAVGVINDNTEATGVSIVENDIHRYPQLSEIEPYFRKNNIEIEWSIGYSSTNNESVSEKNKDAARIYRFNFVVLSNLVREKLKLSVNNLPAAIKNHTNDVKDAIILARELESLLQVIGMCGCLTNKKSVNKFENKRIKINDILSLSQLARIILIEAAPGSGKTTLLRTFSVEALKAQNRIYFLECSRIEVSRFLKIITLRQGRQSKTDKINREIMNEIMLFCKESGTPASWRLDDAFMIVDGLDELPPLLIPVFSEALMSSHNTAKFSIISCRDTYKTVLRDKVPTLHLSKFSLSERDQFVSSWFKNDLKSEHACSDLFKANPGLAESARLPLIATLVAALIENGRAPTTSAEVYEQRLQLLLGEWDKFRGVPRQSAHATHAKRFLIHLAYKMHVANKKEITKIEAQRIFVDVLGIASENQPFDEMLDTLVRIAGVLIIDSVGLLNFGHLSFQEHLAGIYLKEFCRPFQVSHLLGQDWWTEVIRFYADIQGNITNLIEQCDKDGNTSLHARQLLALCRIAPYTSRGAIDVLKDYVRQSRLEQWSGDYIDI